MQKASSYIKLHRKASSNILGIPKFFAGLKQSVQTVKEGWSFLSVGLDVQSAMADMERRQTKGEELGEEEMKQMEADLSGKVSPLFFYHLDCVTDDCIEVAVGRLEGK
jgi:hypothetical protein